MQESRHPTGKQVGAIIFLLHGVHGDETKYGGYAANIIQQSASVPWLNKRVSHFYPVGPYSRWSSKRNFHFSANLTDPNRLHTKEWNTSSFDLPSLILARESLYNLFQAGNLTTRTFLEECQEKHLNVHALLQRPQTLFNDFFGYIDFTAWSAAASQRRSISQMIEKTANDNPGKQLIVLDLHAGIGEPILQLQGLIRTGKDQTSKLPLSRHGLKSAPGKAGAFLSWLYWDWDRTWEGRSKCYQPRGIARLNPSADARGPGAGGERRRPQSDPTAAGGQERR